MIGIDLAGKTVAVTGGASGIGRAVVELCAAAGARVEIADLNGTAAEAVELQLSTRGLDVRSTALDITASNDVDAFFDRVQPDHLVHCAGILTSGGAVETSDEAWSRQLDINLNGLFYCSRAFVRSRLAKDAEGRMVAIASVSGLIGEAGHAAYSASKGAVVNLVRQLAVEYAGRGIRVNGVAPGFTSTGMTSIHSDAVKKWSTSLIPRGQWAIPEEIAGPILFLLSDLASHVHGQTLVIDGGRMAGSPFRTHNTEEGS